MSVPDKIAAAQADLHDDPFMDGRSAYRIGGTINDQAAKVVVVFNFHGR
jgi:hypothetical protein